MGEWWNPFDDENGAFNGSGPTGGYGAGHHSVRGQPQAGQAVNQGNFALNYNGGGTAVTQNAQGLQTDAGNVANQLIQTGQQAGNNVSNAGYQLAQQGNQYAQQGQQTNPLQQANQAQAQAQLNQANQNAAAQMGTARELAAAGGQDTLSAANAQLQQGTNQALNSAMSVAKSGQGFGGSAATLAQAAQAAPQAIANQANQAAMLAAGESQARANRQMAGLQGAGSLLGQAGSQQLQGAGQQAQMEQQNALLRQQGIEANNQLGLGYGNLGLGYNQAALQGVAQGNELAQQSMQNAANAGLGQQLQAGQLGLGGQQLDLQAAQLAQEGNISYEQALNQLYGMDVQSQLGNRQQDIQKDTDAFNAFAGAVGSLGAAAAMSDRRAKTNIEATSLRRRYMALGGM